MDIQQGQGDNGQVPSDAEHVVEEQKDKAHNLKLWVIWQPQEDKLCYFLLLLIFLLLLLSNLQEKTQTEDSEKGIIHV